MDEYDEQGSYNPADEYDPDIFFDEFHPQHELYKRMFPATYKRLTETLENNNA